MSDAAQVEKDKRDPRTREKSKKLPGLSLVVIAVLIGVIFAVAYHSVKSKKEDMEQELNQRQGIIAESRMGTVNAWLKSTAERTLPLANSELFKIFAAEVDKLPAGAMPLLFKAPSYNGSGVDDQVEQISSQMPLMRNMLTETSSANGFLSARIVNARAEQYISTAPAELDQPLTPEQKARVQQVIASSHWLYSPIIDNKKYGLVFELYVPILPPEYQRQDEKAVAVILFTRVADATLTELLGTGASLERGRSVRLVQKSGDIFQEVTPGNVLSIHKLPDFPLDQNRNLPFGKRLSTSGSNGQVYSFGYLVPSADWWVVVENDARLIQNTLKDEAQKLYGLAGLFSLALILLAAAVWWRLVGREQRVINEKFRELLVVIEDQKKLLDGINNTISDPISLADDQGVYKYANKAFATAVGRTEKEVVGLDGPAVFGFDTARRLNASDQHVLMTGENVTVNEILWLQSRRFYFQISKAPLRGEADSRTPKGIVSVFRDITPLVEAEERSHRMVQQTIDALVRAIEEADPFLGGHSRIMGGIAGLIGRQLRLSDADVATIEAAANLSQIGKMFVPREILLKPGALTPEEKQQMERHVEYAYNALKNVEFDLPVLPAILQMNERLDGKGYPRGLSGDQISIHARVLAVANSFAAMARPRSYRAAIPVEEVISILERQHSSYDASVVDALKQVISTPAGERIVQQAATAKAV